MEIRSTQICERASKRCHKQRYHGYTQKKSQNQSGKSIRLPMPINTNRYYLNEVTNVFIWKAQK